MFTESFLHSCGMSLWTDEYINLLSYMAMPEKYSGARKSDTGR